jgi:FkbM family methyltransferase
MSGEGASETGALRWDFGPLDRLEATKRERGGWRLDVLRRPPLHVATVIDVGAGFGTPELYEACPDAYHVLVEPLVEYDEALAGWLERYRGERVACAAGEREGEATIEVDPDAPWISSLLPHRGGGRREPRKVEVATLDRLLVERGWEPPFGLKIDAEGYELRVVQGARRLLEQTRFVLAEVAVGRRLEGGYTFAEFVRAMDEQGFALCDVVDGLRASTAADVLFLDVLFRRI